jgi:carboxylesterase type B
VLEKQYQLLLDVTHCSSLKCLRQVPPDQLDNAVQSTYLSGYSKGDYGRGDFFYGPYVDGKIIRQLPSQEFEQGHFTKIPLFVNHESEEGIIFTDPTMHTEDHDIESIKTLFPSATPSFISKLLDLYPASDFLSAFLRHAEWFGDFIINCPTYYMATAISKMGYPVYKLRFAAGKKVHGSLVPFVETKDIEGMLPILLSSSQFCCR